MELKHKKIAVFVIMGILSLFLFGGCSLAKQETKTETNQKITDNESGANQKATVDESGTNQELTGNESGANPNIMAGEEENDSETVGEFETTDINENVYTEKLFEEYELTMVNVFATWCPPCVNELPDLEKLHEEMKEKGVNVVGMVMDSVNQAGKIEEEGIEIAKVLQKRAGITYPLLIPDAANLNGRLSGIEAYPETFFVDKNGSIVGETYVGSRSLEDWRQVVETELAHVKGE